MLTYYTILNVDIYIKYSNSGLVHESEGAAEAELLELLALPPDPVGLGASRTNRNELIRITD